MKLIKCKECGELIPSDVESCPNCGCPVTTQSKRKLFGAIVTALVTIACVAIAVFCLTGNGKNNVDTNSSPNDSIQQDSIAAQTTNAEQEQVQVDPSLSRRGDMGYSVYETDGGREVQNGVQLMYYIDENTYQGTLYDSSVRDENNDGIELPVIGEVAKDGGLIFTGKLDNVAYSFHIKNTHGTLDWGTHNASYESEYTKGSKTRTLYVSFEHCGEDGD